MNVLLEQNRMLGAIQASQEAMEKRMDAHVTVDEAAHARITELEKAKWQQKGFTSAWSAIISAIVSGAITWISLKK